MYNNQQTYLFKDISLRSIVTKDAVTRRIISLLDNCVLCIGNPTNNKSNPLLCTRTMESCTQAHMAVTIVSTLVPMMWLWFSISNFRSNRDNTYNIAGSRTARLLAKHSQRWLKNIRAPTPAHTLSKRRFVLQIEW